MRIELGTFRNGVKASANAKLAHSHSRSRLNSLTFQDVSHFSRIAVFVARFLLLSARAIASYNIIILLIIIVAPNREAETLKKKNKKLKTIKMTNSMWSMEIFLIESCRNVLAGLNFSAAPSSASAVAADVSNRHDSIYVSFCGMSLDRIISHGETSLSADAIWLLMPKGCRNGMSQRCRQQQCRASTDRKNERSIYHVFRYINIFIDIFIYIFF